MPALAPPAGAPCAPPHHQHPAGRHASACTQAHARERTASSRAAPSGLPINFVIQLLGGPLSSWERGLDDEAAKGGVGAAHNDLDFRNAVEIGAPGHTHDDLEIDFDQDDGAPAVHAFGFDLLDNDITAGASAASADAPARGPTERLEVYVADGPPRGGAAGAEGEGGEEQEAFLTGDEMLDRELQACGVGVVWESHERCCGAPLWGMHDAHLLTRFADVFVPRSSPNLREIAGICRPQSPFIPTLDRLCTGDRRNAARARPQTPGRCRTHRRRRRQRQRRHRSVRPFAPPPFPPTRPRFGTRPPPRRWRSSCRSPRAG